MKNQTVFALLAVLVLALSSCGTTPSAAPTTPTLLPTQQTVIPTNITYPTFTSTPLATAISYPTATLLPTEIPYPTASVVNANAVVFIAENSLWIVNVDGSGERELTDIENSIERTSNYLLKWSPDGKWVSYISSDDLWIISPDGLVKRKGIVISEANNKNKIWSYSWSPDGSEIAYIQTVNGKLTPRLLNLETGDISDLPINTDQLSLSWSPDGQYILLNTYTSLTVFEVTTGEIVKEIDSVSNIHNDCPIWHGGVTWSPNSKWLYHLVSATGTYGLQICLSGLDGSSWQVSDIGGTISSPVWDKTGDYLYFVDGKMNLDIGANWFTNQRLVRYNVKTRKIEDLLSLEEDGPIGYPPINFLSPNGKMLGMYLYPYREDNKSLLKQNKIFILDIDSLSIAKYTLELKGEVDEYYPSPTWSPDSQNIIFLSETNGCFYKFDVRTGKETMISGKHSVEYWAVSPVATIP